jgi:hypothetical protein
MVNKGFLIMVLSALLTFGAFGEGQADKNGKQPFANNFEGKTLTTITGQLFSDNKVFPELNYEGKTVRVMVPRGLLGRIDLSEGEQVTVEGYLLKAGVDKLPPRLATDKGDYLFLTKATVKGKVYDLDKLRGEWGRGPGGRNGGMMRGGFGPCWDNDNNG